MGTVWWASGEGPLAAYAAGYRCELERVLLPAEDDRVG